MRDFKQRRGSQRAVMRFGLSLLAVLVLGLVTFMLARAAWSMYGKFTQAAVADAQEQTQLASLQAQEVQMSAAVNNLDTPRGIEAQVRERYGVVKPGEGVIEIVEPSDASSTAPAPQQGWFGRTWEVLFGWL